MHTPWGESQTVDRIADGIENVTTASHGGIRVSPELNGQIRKEWRDNAQGWAGEPGWYEEDCCWAFVALTFPQHFKGRALAAAHQMVKSLEERHAIAVIATEGREEPTSNVQYNDDDLDRECPPDPVGCLGCGGDHEYRHCGS